MQCFQVFFSCMWAKHCLHVKKIANQKIFVGLAVSLKEYSLKLLLIRKQQVVLRF